MRELLIFLSQMCFIGWMAFKWNHQNWIVSRIIIYFEVRWMKKNIEILTTKRVQGCQLSAGLVRKSIEKYSESIICNFLSLDNTTHDCLLFVLKLVITESLLIKTKQRYIHNNWHVSPFHVLYIYISENLQINCL